MAAVHKRVLQPGERIRVLVVDDSVVIRRLVTHALSQHPELEVVGAAANGSIAALSPARFYSPFFPFSHFPCTAERRS